MNLVDWDTWRSLLLALFLGIAGLAALAFLAQFVVRSSAWRRLIWQIVLVCAVVLTISEWTGAGRGTANFLFGKKPVRKSAAHTVIIDKGVVAPTAVPRITYAPSSPIKSIRWPGWIWLVGLSLILARSCLAHLLLLTLRIRRGNVPDAKLHAWVESLAGRLGIRRRIQLVEMPHSISPMAMGIFRPCLGLPNGFAQLGEAEQTAVLVHELSHVAARDPFWFLVADVACAVVWWHPAIWWARRSFHRAAELAADEATFLVPGGPQTLASFLVGLGKEMSGKWGWVGVRGSFQSELGKRVERLMRLTSRPRRPLAIVSFVLAALSILVVVLLSASIEASPVAAGNLTDELKKSWGDSPGQRILLAALETAPASNNTNDSPNLRAQAPAAFPKNVTVDTNAILSRIRIFSLLDKIQAPKATFNMSLVQVLGLLSMESRKGDPQGMGINFMYNPNSDGAATPGLDPNFIRVKYSQPVKSVSLRGFLEAITKTADSQIRYTVKDYAVVFSPKSAGKKFYTKVFKFNPDTFHSSFNAQPEAKTLSATNFNEMLKVYFSAAGVSFSDTNEVVFANEKLHEIIARGTLDDLAIIDKAVELLDSDPPQIEIDSHFFKLSRVQNVIFWSKWFPGHVSGTDPSIYPFLDISKARIVLDGLGGKDDFKIVSSGRVTTQSGREIRTTFEAADGTCTLETHLTMRPGGVSLYGDVKASVQDSFGMSGTFDGTIRDGQTLVLSLVKTDDQPTWLVFAAVRIINANGNAVHSDEELSGNKTP